MGPSAEYDLNYAKSRKIEYAKLRTNRVPQPFQKWADWASKSSVKRLDRIRARSTGCTVPTHRGGPPLTFGPRRRGIVRALDQGWFARHRLAGELAARRREEAGPIPAPAREVPREGEARTRQDGQPTGG